MSLFGDSPPGESPPPSRSRTLFSNDDAAKSSSLFDDGDDGASSPWETPTPRRKSRADLVRSLLRPSDVPASYIEAFDKILEEDDGGSLGKIGPAGVRRVFSSGRISAERRDEILGIVGAGDDGEMGRNEFNVLLALVALSQEGEKASLDAVDERRGGEFLSFVLLFLSYGLLSPGSSRSCCGRDLRLHFRWPWRACDHWPSSLPLHGDTTVTWDTLTDWLFTFVPSSCRIANASPMQAISGDSGPFPPLLGPFPKIA